jgi:hypothetical protein
LKSGPAQTYVPADLVNLYLPKEGFVENGGFAKRIYGIWSSCDAIAFDDTIDNRSLRQQVQGFKRDESACRDQWMVL